MGSKAQGFTARAIRDSKLVSGGFKIEMRLQIHPPAGARAEEARQPQPQPGAMTLSSPPTAAAQKTDGVNLTISGAGCTVNDIQKLLHMSARKITRHCWKPSRRSFFAMPLPSLRGLAVLLILLAARLGLAQMIDLNGNGMSDVWEWTYNANGISPSADADGDGFSNLQEAIAGTNPFNSNSYPRIPIMFSSPSNFSVTLPCALGKQYQLQSLATLGGTNWVVETNLVARSGTNVTLSAPAAAAMKFYRVGIADVDTSGSGLNDWEKYQLGLDPLIRSATASRMPMAVR